MARHHPYGPRVRAERVPRLRNGVFTLSNYTADEWTAILGNPDFSYILGGKEQAPTTGTRHIQGYFEYSNSRSFNTARRAFFGRAHIEKRRGTQKQAMDYCKKDGNWQEAGTPAEQGKRSDVLDLMKMVRDGESELDVWDQHPVLMFQGSKAYDRYQKLVATPRDRNLTPDVRLYWGPTRSGKTRAAVDEFPDIKFHLSGKWFDTYEAGKAYLFDDFDPSEISLTKVLQVTDRYAIDVEIKGGSATWNPPVIIFTSNDPIETWYPDVSPARREALIIRFTIRHFP